VLLFPAGAYRTTVRIEPRQGHVLRGEGATLSRIDCQIASQFHSCISIAGAYGDAETRVTGGFTKGSTVIEVASSQGFVAGDVIELRQKNNPDVMYTDPRWQQEAENASWARDAVGQMLAITAIDGTRLELAKPLNFTYDAAFEPSIRRVLPIRDVGVENLHIQRNNQDYSGTVSFTLADNCWLRNVESAYTTAAHVSISRGLNIEIRDSYFHHSHNYGDGGHGYGVSVGARTTDSLIENNVFRVLRHSMIIAVGANGNVYAYNYSRERYHDDPTWGLCDLSLHGYYQHENLFEGNVVDKLVIADYWGPAGPNNVFLRNRVVVSGILVNDYSHDQFLIGNEITEGSTRTIEIAVDIRGTVLHGNNEAGTITWDDEHFATHSIPVSFYRQAKPAFFDDLPWPPLGGDLQLGQGTIPAVRRYESELRD
jgi:hypothetical protein